MFFLLNDVVLNVELQTMQPPILAQRYAALSVACVDTLGREMFCEDPQLQHHYAERARRLAALIVAKAPEVNAALFVAPGQDCRPEQVASRYASLDLALLAQLFREQQVGRLTPSLADNLVWTRAAA